MLRLARCVTFLFVLTLTGTSVPFYLTAESATKSGVVQDASLDCAKDWPVGSAGKQIAQQTAHGTPRALVQIRTQNRQLIRP
jgi:hypothetical protein